MKEFDSETLSKFDGRDGQPVYIAFEEKVIDVSASALWKTGTHMNRHRSGSDLAAEISAAPHGPEVLDKFPRIGILKKQESTHFLPRTLEGALERLPFLRRHPHPMLVHYPIVFLISPAVFYIIYLFTGRNSFEITALHCLGSGILFSVPAVLSGFFTWWINYQTKSLKPVEIKIYASAVLAAVSITAFLRRISTPPDSAGAGDMLYLILLIALIPIVSAIGWYGASLTFPLGRK
jgi:predicted heme/steroid binding protein/uncharacterized membrane protein